MQERLTVVTRKGQITVPAEIRQALGIKEGDKVALSLPDPETWAVSLRLVRSVADLTFGAVSPRKRPEDFKELREAFVEGLAEEAIYEASRPRKRKG